MDARTNHLEQNGSIDGTLMEGDEDKPAGAQTHFG
jgi:hypothetical protein